MSNEPRKPSWKSPGAGAGGGKGNHPAPSRKREWQPTAPAAKSTGGTRRLRLLLAALCGAVLLGGIVVALLMIHRYKPPAWIAVAPGFEQNLTRPSNAAGAKAAFDIAEFLKAGSGRPHLHRGNIASIDEWKPWLAEVSEDSVVLFLSMPGGADEQGAFLWVGPPAAPPLEEKEFQKGKLRLRDVFSELGKVPAKTQILLILDATQAAADWSAGMLHNDFARALKGMEKEYILPVDNLVVICSSDDDQRSWVSEVQGKSGFALLLQEGMDPSSGKDHVNALSLFEYLREKVPAWAKANRDEPQTPVLLPQGETGRKRAANISISNIPAGVSSGSKAEPSANAGKLQDLLAAWADRDQLADQVPPPQFTAPDVWRRYLDLLLRAEELFRFGSPAYAKVLDEARGLKPIFSGNPWPTLGSVGLALPMPKAADVEFPEHRLSLPEFNELWGAPEEGEHSRAKVWSRLSATAAADRRNRDTALIWLQRDVVANLYRRLADDGTLTSDDLRRAAAIIHEVYGSAVPPSEAHFLLLLDRDLDDAARLKSECMARVRLALQTRRLGEEVAHAVPADGKADFPASELVYPWLASEIAEADRIRLLGEDMLIGDQPVHWEKANQLLTDAATRYKASRDKADRLRLAFNTRDQILVELPYLARWVAGVRDEFDDTQIEELLKSVDAIGKDAHDLAKVLEEGSLEALGQRDVAKIRDQFDQLKRAYFGKAANLSAESLQSSWHRLDNALKVPFLSAKERKRLLENLQQVSAELDARSRSPKGDGVSKPRLQPDERARRQGRMALAVLGERWVMDPAVREAAGPGAAKYTFSALSKMMEPAGGSWWETLQYQAGEQIGWHWRELARETAKITGRAQGQDLAAALPSLTRADRLARSLAGAEALPEQTRTTEQYRRRRVHDFLLGQARRMIDADWGDAGRITSARVKPPVRYSEQAAAMLIKDAEKLILPSGNLGPEDRKRLLASVTTVRDRLPLPPWAFRGTQPSVDLTAEDEQQKIQFTLSPPPNHRPGYPMLHRIMDGPVKPPAGAFAGRSAETRFVDTTEKGPPDHVLLFVNVDVDGAKAKDKPEGFVGLEMLYRGHRVPAQTLVAMNPDPSTTWTYSPPPDRRAAIAFQAGSGQHAGTVVILLDRSDSMVIDDQGKPVTKFRDAVGALKGILSGLPSRTTVSIFLFGEYSGEQRSPLEPILRPGVHNYAENTKDLDQLIAHLEKYNDVPRRFQYTPLARSIKRIVDDGVFRGASGYKTILVLTDGMDNQSADPGALVASALNRPEIPQEERISLQMVFFQAGNEWDEAVKQFGGIRNFDLPGELWQAKNKDSLSEHLRSAMHPQVVLQKDRKRWPARALPASSNLKGWIRGLEPGLYTVSTSGVPSTTILLQPGDRMIVGFTERNGRTEFVPHRYTEDVATSRPWLRQADPSKRVQVAVGNARLDAARGGDDNLSLLLLADIDFGGAPELSLARPHFFWVEVKPQSTGENLQPWRRLHVQNVPYYPAPAWHVTVPKWPADPPTANVRQSPALPAVSVWWMENWPVGPQTVPRPAGANTEKVFKDKQIDVHGVPVTIESVSFKARRLMVKLKYPAGPPSVIVQARWKSRRDDAALEQRHSFYEDKGVYTAFFGPIDPSEEDLEFTLDFYRLDDLKQGAGAHQVRVLLTPGDKPAVNDYSSAPLPVPLNEN
jgi:hypothetical protein